MLGDEIERLKARLGRSILVLPGNSQRFIAKAAQSPADAVLLDLEDAVSPAEKAPARETVVEALRTVDWGRKTVFVRVNAMDTPFMYRDLITVAEEGGDRLDAIMVPKVESAADVRVVEVLLSQIEAATGRKVRIGLGLQIETARGLQNADAIAEASPRIVSLHFGPGDYAASIQARTTSIGGAVPDYSVLADADTDGRRALFMGDPWHYALSRIVVAARAAGVHPVDGPYADFRDAEGLAWSARRAAALGFEGKWAIHPTQVEAINTAFSPRPEEVARARQILQALAEAEGAGRGALAVDGRMIDAASIRQAEVIVEKARGLEG